MFKKEGRREERQHQNVCKSFFLCLSWHQNSLGLQPPNSCLAALRWAGSAQHRWGSQLSQSCTSNCHYHKTSSNTLLHLFWTSIKWPLRHYLTSDESRDALSVYSDFLRWWVGESVANKPIFFTIYQLLGCELAFQSDLVSLNSNTSLWSAVVGFEGRRCRSFKENGLWAFIAVTSTWLQFTPAALLTATV